MTLPLGKPVQVDTASQNDGQPKGTVVVVLEQRFERTPGGGVWGPAIAGPSFWARYLDIFAKVIVVARVKDVFAHSPGLSRCDSADVEFAGLPHYIGPWGFVKRRRAIKEAAIRAVDAASSVILRVPSPIASCLVPYLRKLKKPYAVEVIGDPYDVMAAGAVDHPLRAIFRRLLTAQLKDYCAGASAAAYVTEHALQRRYPCGGYSVNVSDVQLGSARADTSRVYTTHYSSVTLTECLAHPRSHPPTAGAKIKLITVGSLAQRYKAIDVLIDALAECVSDGMDMSLVVVGDGKYRGELEARAARRGIAARVQFTGYLTREAVTAALDAADIFVLPSRCEGLPRAIIEAMARGLPCIASNIGGISELLPAADLVAPNSVSALSKLLTVIACDDFRRAAMSDRNLKKAHDYLDVKLGPRRGAFYLEVRLTTEAWVAANGPFKGTATCV